MKSLISALLAAIVFGSASWAQTSWIGGVEDLPLMPGLIEMTEKSVVFDKPGGRIVDAEAIGRIDLAAARRFYADTLPALGWSPVGADLFRREGEVLRLVFSREGGNLILRFSINPEAAR